jgi:methionine-gamma-lyase
MASGKKTHFNSKCVHAGINEYEFGPVVTPIYQTSTFKFKSTRHGAALFKGEEDGYIYTRMKNPTIEAMEDAVAALEGGVKALGCGSGMAAISTTLLGLLQSGDHIICSKAVYGPTATLVRTVLSKFEIEASFVSTSDPIQVEEAVKENTKLIYVETPGNPTLEITDLEATAAIAKKHNALLVVDNTFMSPALQKPLEFGADIIVHSMTKFLNGHADVVAGIIVVKNDEHYSRLRKILNQLGGVIDPFNAFLVHRGIKTLHLRMQRHSENALKIARYLESHKLVRSVSFPGLPTHPQYEIGQKQHSAPGGMISFELEGGIAAGEKLMNSVELCQLAVSLGGVETLIQHPASMTHLSMGREAREKAGITDGLVRISVGIESADDLITDLDEALKQVEIILKETSTAAV